MNINLTLKEFKNKIKEIPEIKIETEKHEILEITVSGPNKDINNHLIKILSNLQLSDMYKIDNNRWIEKAKIDNLTESIKNATSYDEMINTLQDVSFIFGISTFVSAKDRKMETGIQCKMYKTDMAIGQIFINKLKEVEEIKVRLKDSHNIRFIEIRSTPINEEQKCKSKCRTDYRIGKIDEIFGCEPNEM